MYERMLAAIDYMCVCVCVCMCVLLCSFYCKYLTPTACIQRGGGVNGSTIDWTVEWDLEGPHEVA